MFIYANLIMDSPVVAAFVVAAWGAITGELAAKATIAFGGTLELFFSRHSRFIHALQISEAALFVAAVAGAIYSPVFLSSGLKFPDSAETVSEFLKASAAYFGIAFLAGFVATRYLYTSSSCRYLRVIDEELSPKRYSAPRFPDVSFLVPGDWIVRIPEGELAFYSFAVNFIRKPDSKIQELPEYPIQYHAPIHLGCRIYEIGETEDTLDDLVRLARPESFGQHGRYRDHHEQITLSCGVQAIRSEFGKLLFPATFARMEHSISFVHNGRRWVLFYSALLQEYDYSVAAFDQLRNSVELNTGSRDAS